LQRPISTDLLVRPADQRELELSRSSQGAGIDDPGMLAMALIIDALVGRP
jgi:hypothetical protein